MNDHHYNHHIHRQLHHPPPPPSSSSTSSFRTQMTNDDDDHHDDNVEAITISSVTSSRPDSTTTASTATTTNSITIDAYNWKRYTVIICALAHTILFVLSVWWESEHVWRKILHTTSAAYDERERTYQKNRLLLRATIIGTLGLLFLLAGIFGALFEQLHLTIGYIALHTVALNWALICLGFTQQCSTTTGSVALFIFTVLSWIVAVRFLCDLYRRQQQQKQHGVWKKKQSSKKYHQQKQGKMMRK